MQNPLIIFTGWQTMNEKRIHQKIIKISKTESKQLKDVLKRTGKTFTELVVERVVYYFQDHVFKEIKRILKMEKVYQSVYREYKFEDKFKFQASIYKVGDILKFNDDGHFSTVVKILEEEGVLKVSCFPFTMKDETELIFLEEQALSFKIYRR